MKKKDVAGRQKPCVPLDTMRINPKVETCASPVKTEASIPPSSFLHLPLSLRYPPVDVCGASFVLAFPPRLVLSFSRVDVDAPRSVLVFSTTLVLFSSVEKHADKRGAIVVAPNNNQSERWTLTAFNTFMQTPRMDARRAGVSRA